MYICNMKVIIDKYLNLTPCLDAMKCKCLLDISACVEFLTKFNVFTSQLPNKCAEKNKQTK